MEKTKQTDRQTKKGTEKHNWGTGNRKSQVRNRVRTKHRVKAKVNLKSFFFNSLWSSIQNKCVRWGRVLFLWNSKPHYSSSQKCSQLHLCYNSTFLWLTPSVGVTADTLKNTGGLETLEAPRPPLIMPHCLYWCGWGCSRFFSVAVNYYFFKIVFHACNGLAKQHFPNLLKCVSGICIISRVGKSQNTEKLK